MLHRIQSLQSAATGLRLIINTLLRRLGLGDESFLLILAVLIGAAAAAAAVGFHQLIDATRHLLYNRLNDHIPLYSGAGVWLLFLLPAAGGLAVGLISRFVVRVRSGSGIIDVMESVSRGTGRIDPAVAVEKILTSGITIGSGGSAGAEGPIIQIGAGIASGFGSLFGIARQHMPVLIGCGSAAGISAIFNAPIGGVLFTLEVILRDFSIRTFTPVVIAAVVANLATGGIFHRVLGQHFDAIFTLPAVADALKPIELIHLLNFTVLGIACGLVGLALIRLMHFMEGRFAKLPVHKTLRPMLGGALLGLLGVLFITVIGWGLLGREKLFAIQDYVMPAFFGDGYPAMKRMLESDFYSQMTTGKVVIVLLFLLGAKLLGTCFTLGSGGSGGVIAPSLFLGAVTGGLLGLAMRTVGAGPPLDPLVYALIGMGAVLAAVVHAPLAAVLILFEVTRQNGVMLPGMLSCVVAAGVARVIFRDSIYTLGLRQRGVAVGSAGDLALLRRMSVEQVPLEPAAVVRAGDPFQHILDLIESTGAGDFVVVDGQGIYAGMVVGEDIQTALIQHEAVPLLLVGELMRPEIPLVRTADDLAAVLAIFTRHDIDRLPVGTGIGPGRVIGLISRSALMRHYQGALSGEA